MINNNGQIYPSFSPSLLMINIKETDIRTIQRRERERERERSPLILSIPMSSAFGTPIPPPSSAVGPPVFKDPKMQYAVRSEQHTRYFVELDFVREFEIVRPTNQYEHLF